MEEAKEASAVALSVFAHGASADARAICSTVNRLSKSAEPVTRSRETAARVLHLLFERGPGVK